MIILSSSYGKPLTLETISRVSSGWYIKSGLLTNKEWHKVICFPHSSHLPQCVGIVCPFGDSCASGYCNMGKHAIHESYIFGIANHNPLAANSRIVISLPRCEMIKALNDYRINKLFTNPIRNIDDWTDKDLEIECERLGIIYPRNIQVQGLAYA